MTAATNADPTQSEDPYGAPTNPPIPPSLYVNFLIVAMAESWGEYMGFLYTAKKYENAPFSPWFNRTENLRTRNNFIPEGLHYDLIDGINTVESNGLNDNVEGATLLELYQLLNNETVVGYRSEVISSTSATGDILTLFSQYGY